MNTLLIKIGCLLIFASVFVQSLKFENTSAMDRLSKVEPSGQVIEFLPNKQFTVVYEAPDLLAVHLPVQSTLHRFPTR